MITSMRVKQSCQFWQSCVTDWLMFGLSCESDPVRPTDQNLVVKSMFAKQEHQEIPIHSHSLLHRRTGTHTRAHAHTHTLFFSLKDYIWVMSLGEFPYCFPHHRILFDKYAVSGCVGGNVKLKLCNFGTKVDIWLRYQG